MFEENKPDLDDIVTAAEALFGINYDEDNLAHYGKKHFSGRYPEGSGENPYQHCGNFKNHVKELKATGLTEKQIADMMGMSVVDFRNKLFAANIEDANKRYEQCRALREKGLSFRAIAKELGYKNESSVRSALNEESKILRDKVINCKNFLKEQVDENKFIDIGPGVEHQLGISRTRLKLAISMLEEEGYHKYSGRREQMTNPGQMTTYTYLTAPEILPKEGNKVPKEIFDPANHHSLEGFETNDDGKTFVKTTMNYPESLSSKRIKVIYGDQGGEAKDGLIELRRGVPDIALDGTSNYAQVRILVDGTHYMKGMAVYNDNMPEGVDVIFNTNKKTGTPIMGSDNAHSVLKNIEVTEADPNNPFGAAIKKQPKYIDKDGNEKQGVINIKSEEGDWGDWADKLASQFLAKQNQPLVDQQLKISIDNKNDQFESLKSINNPVLKKKLLEDFAQECDADSVDLYAAALPRQKYQVILPLTTIKDNEIYAPNYADGEQVALIRYPHAGTFEIPILTVNNKNKEGKAIITPGGKDAVGISAKAAKQLSGADFDGDTAMIIPLPKDGSFRISTKKPLEGVADFDPEEKFYEKPGMKLLTKKNTQREMGIVSNLIMDMTIKGATDEELARAVKHSMVVIDAAKHHYDYKLSEQIHNIAELKERYQAHIDPETGRTVHGASTLLTMAKSDASRLKTQGTPKTDPVTGELVYKLADPYVHYKTGELKYHTQKSTKMAETKDAHSLSSGSMVEEAYADYANALKAMANKARLEALNTKNIPHSSEARKEYAAEVKHLEKMIKKAESNAPRERQAQAIASVKLREIEKEEGEKLDKARKQKISQRLLTKAREEAGAKRVKIKFTDREWEAIQKGALFTHSQQVLFKYADKDELIERATPRERRTLTQAQITRLNSLLSRGYTRAAVAEAMGISTSTIDKYSMN